jgi:membrane protein implicated in regulation of membrane protease activity
MMESEDRAKRDDLSPAEALASTRVARETLARRVSVPWTWDAFMATSLGVVLWLLADYPTTAPFVVVPCGFAVMWIKRARQRRVGVVSDGRTSRTLDPLHWWVPVVAMAVGVIGIWNYETWPPALPVSAVLAATVIYLGFRWINRRAIARIRNAQ